MQKFFEFLSMGIVTPFAYLVYAVVVIALTFLLGLPLAIGIYFIQMFIDFLFHGGISYANL
jgi:hypothetical protein